MCDPWQPTEKEILAIIKDCNKRFQIHDSPVLMEQSKDEQK